MAQNWDDESREWRRSGGGSFCELAKLTADMIDWQENVIRLGEHKNEKKGKTRTIYLVPEMVGLLSRLAEKHPSGLLFRNAQALTLSASSGRTITISSVIADGSAAEAIRNTRLRTP